MRLRLFSRLPSTDLGSSGNNEKLPFDADGGKLCVKIKGRLNKAPSVLLLFKTAIA